MQGAEKTGVGVKDTFGESGNMPELFDKYGRTPSWPLLECYCERLTESFAPQSFHCVWSHNALDHTQQPDVVFRNMVAVLRPAGYLIVQAWSREGTSAGWTGLHQHDLTLDASGQLFYESLCADGATGPPVNLAESQPLEVVDSSGAASEPRTWLRVVYRKTA